MATKPGTLFWELDIVSGCGEACGIEILGLESYAYKEGEIIDFRSDQYLKRQNSYLPSLCTK